MRYDHLTIEPKWQKRWTEMKAFKASDDSKKPSFYCLDFFPYPSGAGLHVGHPRGYFATDIYSRYLRMKGYEVLHPMGWDAFGLPAENYAIKHKIHPKITTAENIVNFKRQLLSLGLGYDWDREINTTDPTYYRWTQWIFLKLYERGLAYEAEVPINWCPSCKTGLANEEVVDGRCERCGTLVTKKRLRQWLLRITAYAERLLNDLEKLDWPARIVTMQRNWIGKSHGATVRFKVEGPKSKDAIEVFTTRPDTLFGATYMVLAPEHPLVREITTPDHAKEIEAYIHAAETKTDMERSALEKEKTGVFTGAYALNPVNDEKIPIWIADYVLMGYGTGAIMAVPGHDARDYQFAKKYKLPIKKVIEPPHNVSETDFALVDGEKVFVGDGVTVNSGEFSGLASAEMRIKIVEWLTKQGKGNASVAYKLRDWVFSRQRYWGEPIPILHCEKCGTVPVPVSGKDLPVLLPEVERYEPTGTGESPLAAITEWVNTRCPQCKGPAKRETNTMPQWAGSSWYFLRFADPHNQKVFADPRLLKKWLPVTLYVGGAEHAVLHLLYARFWTKVLFDSGELTFEEPFSKLRNQGLILAEDGRKMSKSFGNVINPDEIVESYGADTLRMYEMFMGPFTDEVAWSTASIQGVYRFLNKVWTLGLEIAQSSKLKAEGSELGARSSETLERLLHKTVKKVTEDIENFRFNTAISAMMIFANELLKVQGSRLNDDRTRDGNNDSNAFSFELSALSRENFEKFLKVLSPFAPHLVEELWERLGHTESIMHESWPMYDPKLTRDEEIELVIQVNGKVRDTIITSSKVTEEEALKLVQQSEKISKYLKGEKVEKVVFVPGKLLNIVTEQGV
ncbi:MAG: leucine--tRNA ligase [Parcubacteria group bacterium]|nr:leucine--tRNA ligase [Parcubacteria group bacterium]